MNHSKDDILQHINLVLIKLFELDADQLVPEAKLYEDLDIDSIDTIDLLIELKKFVGKNIDPQAFKNASTIDDVANIIHQL